MKVILLENVNKLGTIGQIIDVKRGYARNYLISNKKALYASKENIKEVEKIKVELNKKDLEKKKTAKNIADKLASKQYEFKRLVTENNELYGSIKPTEISKIIFEKDNISVKPSSIQLLKEIREIGNFKVKIILHSEVHVDIKIKVSQEDSNN